MLRFTLSTAIRPSKCVVVDVFSDHRHALEAFIRDERQPSSGGWVDSMGSESDVVLIGHHTCGRGLPRHDRQSDFLGNFVQGQTKRERTCADKKLRCG
jgi:hypothetical protein